MNTAALRSLAVVSDEVSQELATVAAFAREFKLSAIELRSMFGRAFKDLTDRDVAEISRVSDGEGWRICACAAPVFKCELGDIRAEFGHRDIFRRSLDIARRLDCRILRVFTFLRQNGELTLDLVRRIAACLRPLCELASAAGIRVGIENEASCLVGTPQEMALLFSVLDHPSAGIIWDPCNVLYVPRKRGQPLPDLAVAFDALSPKIVHVHVKDAQISARAADPPTAMPVGQGNVDWAGQFAAGQQCGYTGAWSLETHWRAKSLDERLLHLAAGYAFSEGGEEASRICLQRLIELCNAS